MADSGDYDMMITARATRRRLPYKWRQICSISFVIVCTSDKNGQHRRERIECPTVWEDLDSNLYSRSPHPNGSSPLCEGIGSNLDSNSLHLNGRSPFWEGLDSKEGGKVSIFEEIGQGHEVQFIAEAIRWKMSKMYTTSVFTFVIFAKVRPVRTKVTDRHIHTDKHTHTHTETDKLIGKILLICLKK